MSLTYVSHHNKSIIVSVSVVFICIILYPVYVLVIFHIPFETELAKCPSCLGSNLCDCFVKSEFRLNWDYLWTNWLNILYKKSIVFGSCGDQMVVLKWYEGYTVADNNDTFHAFNSNSDLILESVKKLSRLKHSYLPQDFILCPSTNKLGSFFKPIILEGNLGLFAAKSVLEIYQNIFYTLQLSMEPLIQQPPPEQMTVEVSESQKSEVCVYCSEVMADVRNNFLNNINLPSPTMNVISDWAVARYLGACGNIAVSEYCGNSLTSIFQELSWAERSSIAGQLLLFALNATFVNPEFAFYFTDLSPDNFAVSDNNEVRLIDLDNVIVVDKNPADEPEDWGTTHASYHDESIRGFAFSTEEICSHRISDSNIYAICQGILSEQSELLKGGLLHSPPTKLSSLTILVEDCISPPAEHSRFDIAYSLLRVLDITLHDSVVKNI